MSSKILVVEDCSDSFQLIKRALGASTQIEWAKSQREAAAILEKKNFDLIMLDVMLPDGDGFQLCSMLQTYEKWSATPKIFLSAKNSVADKVMGFSVGADDFVSKPFDPLELKARVESKLRKRERDQQAADTIIINDLEINKTTQRVFATSEGTMLPLDLTPTEFKLLLFMASRANAVVSRDEILNGVWGENVFVYNRSVDTHVSKLRKKLGSRADYIVSVHRFGYRLVTDGADNGAKKVDLSGAFNGALQKPAEADLPYRRIS